MNSNEATSTRSGAAVEQSGSGAPTTQRHTPGPWRVRTEDGSIGSIDAPDFPVAQAFEVSVEDRLNKQSIRRANANLISAAPDLLRELTHLAKLLEPALNNGKVQVPGLATLNGAWLAIAKARGQS